VSWLYISLISLCIFECHRVGVLAAFVWQLFVVAVVSLLNGFVPVLASPKTGTG
jgi:hypothetical protein